MIKSDKEVLPTLLALWEKPKRVDHLIANLKHFVSVAWDSFHQEFVSSSLKSCENSLCFNSLTPGRCPKSRIISFSNANCSKLLWRFSSETYLWWMPMFSSQQWFSLCLGAVRQQAITWTIVDQDPCCHMASLGSNELIQILTKQSSHKFATKAELS